MTRSRFKTIQAKGKLVIINESEASEIDESGSSYGDEDSDHMMVDTSSVRKRGKCNNHYRI